MFFSRRAEWCPGGCGKSIFKIHNNVIKYPKAYVCTRCGCLYTRDEIDGDILYENEKASIL